MLNRWKPWYKALVLDALILALLTFYRFNFVFPENNEFIFSGDFLRPIMRESTTQYYIYPFVLNEHGGYVDPTFILKIPYWSIVVLISYLIPLNLAYWLLIVITQILGGLLISTSARTFFFPHQKILYYMIPLIPSIFASLSYPINYRPYWHYLVLLPGLLQCVFVVAYRTFSGNKLHARTKLLLVLIGYLASLQIHIIAFIAITLAFVSFAIILFQSKRLKTTKDYLSINFWLFLPFLFFLVPTFMMTFTGQSLTPPYVYSYSILESFSSEANFVNALTFSIGSWEKVIYTNLDKLFTLLIVSFVVTLYSLRTRARANAFVLSVFFTFVISIFFELGMSNPVYKLLASPSNPFAWVLRDPFKISLVSLGLFTLLFTFTLRYISLDVTVKKGRAIIASFLVFAILSLAVWSPASKTLEIIHPVTIPEEYFNAANYLNEKTNGPLLFLPIYGKGYLWSNNPYLEGSFLARSYQHSYIDYTITKSKEVKELLAYGTFAKNLKVLSLVTSGIVIDASMEGYGSSFDRMAHYILSNYSETTLKFGDYLHFLPNREYSRFRILGDYIYLIAPIDYKYLGSFGEFLNGSKSVLFFDDSIASMRNAEIIELSSELNEPSIAWSLGYTYDPLHGPWHYYLEERNIENWQSDYGKGLIFTWATSRLEKIPSPANEDLMNQWVFDSTTELDQWKYYSPENQFGALHYLTLDNSALKAELWNSTWGWKTIKSPLIPVQNHNWYRWVLQIRGENVHKAHVKIFEYNEEKEIVSGRQVKWIGSGNFDWNTIVIDFTPESAETKYLQLQMWHGHETEQPVPNTIWIDNVKVYDLQRFVEPIILEIPIQVRETGNYVFLTRCFENQQGGEIEIRLDNATYSIDTEDRLNRFTWKEIDTLHLEKGLHRITITNLEGFNAINLFALISENEYQNAQDRIEQSLKDKRVIHILEAESDLYYENTTKSHKYNGASNGQILILNQNSTTWQNLTIAKTDEYKLAIRSEGQLQVQIDNRTYTINSTIPDWNYLNIMHLNKGNHKIEITTPTTGELDVIWLFSTENSNETLKDIFKTEEKHAQITKSTRVDPTKYIVEINATQPFILSFAEAYDPLWSAYVNGKRIEPMPLYSALNGFEINYTGRLEISIQYEPQKWFYYGSVISVTIFVACLVCLTYVWTKKKAVWKRLRTTFKNYRART